MRGVVYKIDIVKIREKASRGFGVAILLLATCASGAHAGDVNAGWVEVRSAHFTVMTNSGEKNGRHVAAQFEEIRSMFQNTLTSLRVDPPQPIVILAAKDENTMKALLPEDWEVKGHVHHAGMYQQGEDKHYVLMQLDMGGNNPFHTLYHEYTHALLHLNYSRLPLWLDEGLAEFFGNSELGDKESKTGTVDENHLRFLNESKLLPIETLLEVDYNSPYYNEANRASVFYAQSWALIHYLLMDPEARQKQLLPKFFAAWDKTGNQIQAAQESFGDLKRFGQVVEAYSHKQAFHILIVKSSTEEADKNSTTRALPVAEVLALRGDASTHRNKLEQAEPLIAQSIQLDPKMAMAHEALGFYKLRKQDFAGASQEMETAAQLGSKSFAVFYYHGMALLRGSSGEAPVQEAVKNLQRATELNPQFAPAFQGLAQAYSRKQETQTQAIDAAFKAVRLDPHRHAYVLSLAYLLMNNDHDADARILGEKLVVAATSPEEAQLAHQLLDRLREREEWKAQMQAQASTPSPSTEGPADSSGPAGVAAPTRPADVARPVLGHIVGFEGAISAIDCSHSPEVRITMNMSQAPITLHSADFRLVSVSAASPESLPALESCGQWTGRRVKVWFRMNPVKDYAGEITQIHFY
jgi:tetratricopeptide (TPR) repeat protein